MMSSNDNHPRRHLVLFRNKNRPRSCLDLRVGGKSSSHILEVVLHLRRADFDWYDSHQFDITSEFLELLEGSVVPRMFGKEIEAYHRKNNPNFVTPEDYDGSIARVGSKNKNSTTKGKKQGGKSKKQAAGAAKKNESINQEQDQNKREKQIYFSFGELIQLAYRCQPTKSHRTILYGNKYSEDKRDNRKGKFLEYPKLPQRLLIWISRIDPEQKTNPDPKGVGFHRPDMIPISSLFRKPAEFSDEEDD